ncbi:MAG: arylesterase [Roseobacter sp.]
MRKAIFGIVMCLPALAAADETVIAALGDSLTQGYGLPQEQGLVPQLNNWLTGQGADVRIINAGVSGDTTAGGAARVGWTLTPDVDAMIVALGANDVLRGIDPAITRANLTTILQVAADAEVSVLLVGINAPANYGPEYKTSFDAIYADLAAEFGALHAGSIFDGLGHGQDLNAARALMQPDGIHPNAEGVALIAAELGPDVLELITEVSKK